MAERLLEFIPIDKEYWPSREEYYPGFSAEQWLDILRDGNTTRPQDLELLRMILAQGGECTCAHLSKVYGNTAKHYNALGMLFGQRVQRNYACPDCYDEEEDRHIFYVIPFQGRNVREDGKRHFTWRLRDELRAALEQLGDGEVSQTRPASGTDVPLNTILYGPPGTGKTYALPVYALSILEDIPLSEVEGWEREEILARYREYCKQGRVDFTTFHQSYGYEEFIEGIRPVLRDDSPDVQCDAGEERDGSCGEIAYRMEAGIFKAFCEQAEMFDSRRVNAERLGISDQSSVWKVSLEGTGDNPTRRECLDSDHIRIGWDQYGENVELEAVTSGKVSLNAFLNRMQVNDIVLSCYSKDEIDAIGIVTGEPEWHDEYAHYKRLRKVKWLDKTVTNIRALNGGKKMTLSAVYQLHDITPGIVLDILEKNHPEWSSRPVEKRNFVFIIDEINRGNISKIFGELITLIEPSKRKGAPEAASATLPYSKTSFRVPGNVYLLCTMNTADRSIAPIDTALRRRFQFRELPPRPELLEGIEVEGLSVARMLERMNLRIAALYDREHAIGHSYLLPLRESPDMAALARAFRENILPLLQEYFYDDYEKIRLVLGDNQKSGGCPEFISATDCDAQELFGNADAACAERVYEIHPAAFEAVEAYRYLQ